MFHVIPIVDTLSRYVDQRIRVASVTAESTLTRDTVPVNVDAITVDTNLGGQCNSGVLVAADGTVQVIYI